jgi:hypothetical protein
MFVANTFVPLSTLPGPLRFVAEWNPASAVTLAARERFGNADPKGSLGEATSWALAHPELYTLIWSAVILLVCAPLATAQFRRTASG